MRNVPRGTFSPASRFRDRLSAICTATSPQYDIARHCAQIVSRETIRVRRHIARLISGYFPGIATRYIGAEWREPTAGVSVLLNTNYPAVTSAESIHSELDEERPRSNCSTWNNFG